MGTRHGKPKEGAERLLTFDDNRLDYGEQRWVTLGLLGEQVVVIVHTETENEIRVISMREAEKDEQPLFFTNLRRSR